MTDTNSDLLAALAAPFPAQDIEWRVSRSGVSGQGAPWAKVLAFITARAIQTRLDQVVGVAGWKNEMPQILTINGKSAFAVGISLRLESGEWLTKWDVADPTNIEPSKGGFSGGMKRAGAQFGIGRYLYHLDETYADCSETDPKVRGWHWAKLPKDKGGASYYWKEPSLPGWALPPEGPEHEVSEAELNDLKRQWKDKFATDADGRADLRDGFDRFVTAVVGDFPSADHTCWSKQAIQKCVSRIQATEDAGDISPDVPFTE